MDNKKAQLIAALESHYKAKLDEFTLDINYYLDTEPNLNELITSIGLYTKVMSEFNFVQRLKEQMIQDES